MPIKLQDRDPSKFYISGSMLDSFTCSHRWYQQRINPQPELPTHPKSLGSVIHKWLEYYYLDELASFDFEKATKLYEAGFEDGERSKDELAEILQCLEASYPQALEEFGDSWEVLDTEVKLKVEKQYSGLPFVLSGEIDLLAKKGDENILIDHKTTNSISNNLKHFEIASQLRFYAWLLREQTGKEVDTLIYNIIRSQPPRPPMTLKSGKLSKDKRQSTTSHLYRQALVDRDLDLEEYQEFIYHLELGDARFFRRIYIPMTEQAYARIDFQVEELTRRIKWIMETSDMESKHSLALRLATPSRICGECPYFDPCLQELGG